VAAPAAHENSTGQKTAGLPTPSSIATGRASGRAVKINPAAATSPCEGTWFPELDQFLRAGTPRSRALAGRRRRRRPQEGRKQSHEDARSSTASMNASSAPDARPPASYWWEQRTLPGAPRRCCRRDRVGPRISRDEGHRASGLDKLEDPFRASYRCHTHETCAKACRRAQPFEGDRRTQDEAGRAATDLAGAGRSRAANGIQLLQGPYSIGPVAR